MHWTVPPFWNFAWLIHGLFVELWGPGRQNNRKKKLEKKPHITAPLQNFCLIRNPILLCFLPKLTLSADTMVLWLFYSIFLSIVVLGTCAVSWQRATTTLSCTFVLHLVGISHMPLIMYTLCHNYYQILGPVTVTVIYCWMSKSILLSTFSVHRRFSHTLAIIPSLFLEWGHLSETFAHGIIIYHFRVYGSSTTSCLCRALQIASPKNVARPRRTITEHRARQFSHTLAIIPSLFLEWRHLSETFAHGIISF